MHFSSDTYFAYDKSSAPWNKKTKLKAAYEPWTTMFFHALHGKEQCKSQGHLSIIGVFPKWSITFIKISEFSEFRESEKSVNSKNLRNH